MWTYVVSLSTNIQKQQSHYHLLDSKFKLFKALGDLIHNLLFDCRATRANRLDARRGELHRDAVLPSVIHGYIVARPYNYASINRKYCKNGAIAKGWSHNEAFGVNFHEH